MRITPPLLAMALLAACAEPPAADIGAQQEAACIAAIAAHVRRPASEISARRISAAAGIALIETRDGDRLHLCRADAAGRVLGYDHPGQPG